MKTTFAATAFVLASALIGSTSFAADSATMLQNSEATPATPYTVSSLTREQVKAEVLQAQKDGTLVKVSEASPATPTTSNSTLTRAQVRAEYFQAVKDGTLIHNTEAGAPAITANRQAPVQATSTMAGHSQGMPVSR